MHVLNCTVLIEITSAVYSGSSNETLTWDWAARLQISVGRMSVMTLTFIKNEYIKTLYSKTFHGIFFKCLNWKATIGQNGTVSFFNYNLYHQIDLLRFFFFFFATNKINDYLTSAVPSMRSPQWSFIFPCAWVLGSSYRCWMRPVLKEELRRTMPWTWENIVFFKLFSTFGFSCKRIPNVDSFVCDEHRMLSIRASPRSLIKNPL